MGAMRGGKTHVGKPKCFKWWAFWHRLHQTSLYAASDGHRLEHFDCSCGKRWDVYHHAPHGSGLVEWTEQ
jgi:hypothetical protein